MHLAERLARDPGQDPIVEEADFKALWLEHCAGLPPFEMAVQAGLLADRFSWIFTAGYQGAMRHVFPQERFDGWAAFAVSEDRSEDNPLPGVTWQADGPGFVIEGSKTWVAASAHCDDIVFSAGRGGAKRFFSSQSADTRRHCGDPTGGSHVAGSESGQCALCESAAQRRPGGQSQARRWVRALRGFVYLYGFSGLDLGAHVSREKSGAGTAGIGRAGR